MNDDELAAAVKEAVRGAHMIIPAEQIVHRSRAVRARRWIPAAVSGLALVAAAAAVLCLGLSGAFGAGQVRDASPAQARVTGTIRTAAFTLVRHANGTATLTINPHELLDAAALQNDLQQYGIPAMVTSGSFCSSDPAPVGFSQVVSFYPAGHHHPVVIPPGIHPTVTFNPSAMPAGTELSFGIFQLSSGGQQADFTLINPNSYTCTSAPLQPPHPGIVEFQVGAGPVVP
jgi:hypothetical protein